MTRKEIDTLMQGHKTYQHATPACKRRFAQHLQKAQKLSGAVPMDVIVREAWIWFWLGWFRQ